MRVSGWVIVVVTAVLVGVFMVATSMFGEDARPDYRVVTGKHDTERTDLALTDTHVAWLEDARPGGAVWVYDIAAHERTELEAEAASLLHPVLLSERWLVWVEGEGPLRVVVRDLASGDERVLGAGPEDGSVLLPGRTLDGDHLVVAGRLGGKGGMFLVDLGLPEPSPQRIVEPPPAGAVGVQLDRGLLWWGEGGVIAAADMVTGEIQRTLPTEGGGDVVDLDVDGDLVAWTEDLGRIRGVRVHDLATGTTAPLSREAEGDQLQPALHGTRAVFIQHDGLVRFVDLASGFEQVLPARTQENIELRIAPGWAAWLSGTIEGHNAMLVPWPDASA